MQYPPWPFLPGTGGWVIGLIAGAFTILAHAAVGAGFLFALGHQRSLPLPRQTGKPARLIRLLPAILLLAVSAASRNWAWAAGGIFLLALSENRPAPGASAGLADMARRGTRLLVWISVVLGSSSCVWVWVAMTVLHPAAASALANNFLWFWGAAWSVFAVGIAAVLLWDAAWDRPGRGLHRLMGWTYVAAAWTALAIVNGVTSFMLTPGRWIETRNAWDGFFNPTLWPSLFLRSGVALMVGAAVGLIVASRLDRTARTEVNRFVAAWGLAGFAVAASGYAWWQRALDPVVQASFARPGQPLYGMWMLMHWGAALGLLVFVLAGFLSSCRLPGIGGAAVLAVVAVPVICFESIREAVRLPYIIHGYMYANGIRVEDVAHLRTRGFRSQAGWIAAKAPATREELGGLLFRAQCGVCHGIDGPLAIRPRVRDRDVHTLDRTILLLHQTDPRMPPFAGNARERAALAEYLAALQPPEPEPAPAAAIPEPPW